MALRARFAGFIRPTTENWHSGHADPRLHHCGADAHRKTTLHSRREFVGVGEDAISFETQPSVGDEPTDSSLVDAHSTSSSCDSSRSDKDEIDSRSDRYLPHYIDIELAGGAAATERSREIVRDLKEEPAYAAFHSLIQELDAPGYTAEFGAEAGERRVESMDCGDDADGQPRARRDTDTHDDRRLRDAFAALANLVAAHVRDPQASPPAPTFASRSEPRIWYTESVDRCKPNICVQYEGGGDAFSQVVAVGEVKAATREDERDSLLTKLCRYAAALVGRRPFVTVCHGFTLCGSVLRLWRLDAQSNACTMAVDLCGGDEHLQRFVALVAFLTGEDALRRWSPAESDRFRLCNVRGEEEEFVWAQAPQQLNRNFELFGTRMCCWGGKAYKLGERDSIDVVLKLSWIPPHLVDHEGVVLEHLKAQQVQDVPHLLSRLLLEPDLTDIASNGAAFELEASYEGAAHERSGLFVPEMMRWSRRGMALSAFAVRSPIGYSIDEASPSVALDLLRMFRGLGKMLRRVAEAGVRYRDLNTGNVLLPPVDADPAAPAVLLIDFGNARIGDTPRGNLPADGAAASSNAGITAPLIVRLSADDARSINEYFVPRKTIMGATAVQDVERKFAERELARAAASQGETSSKKQGLLRNAETDFDRAMEKLEALQHRPIDDLESATWCFLWQSAECGTNDLEGLHDLKHDDFKAKWLTYGNTTARSEVVERFGLQSDALKELLQSDDGLPYYLFHDETREQSTPPRRDIHSSPGAATSLLRDRDRDAFDEWESAFARAIATEEQAVSVRAAAAAAAPGADAAAATAGAPAGRATSAPLKQRDNTAAEARARAPVSKATNMAPRVDGQIPGKSAFPYPKRPREPESGAMANDTVPRSRASDSRQT